MRHFTPESKKEASPVIVTSSINGPFRMYASMSYSFLATHTTSLLYKPITSQVFNVISVPRTQLLIRVPLTVRCYVKTR